MDDTHHKNDIHPDCKSIIIKEFLLFSLQRIWTLDRVRNNHIRRRENRRKQIEMVRIISEETTDHPHITQKIKQKEKRGKRGKREQLEIFPSQEANAQILVIKKYDYYPKSNSDYDVNNDYSKKYSQSYHNNWQNIYELTLRRHVWVITTLEWSQ